MDREASVFRAEAGRDIQHVDERGRPICKLIFEGAELVGKSTLTSAMYQRLVHAYTSSNEILDGCYYLYCDIGIFSTPLARDYIFHMAKIVELMKERNVVMDKFHLADEVYQKEYRGKTISHRWVEDEILRPLGTRMILITVSEDHLEQRLQQRLKSDPHYALIKKPFDFYKRMQERYLQAIQHTTLDWLLVDGTIPPEENVTRILAWANMPTLERRDENTISSNTQ
jgi:thymidylate kinase